MLNTYDDKLRRFQRSESDDNNHLAAVDIVLRHGVTQPAAHEIGVRGLLALEGAGPEQAVHKTSDVTAQRRPQAVIIRFEHGPLDTVINTLFDVDGGAAYRHITPFGIGLGR